MPETQLPGVLIYRNELLECSETFIAAQTSALRRYQPTYCGLHTRAGGILPASSSPVVLGRHHGLLATAQRTLYLQAGLAPRWMARVQSLHGSLMHAHFALDAACALPLAQHLGIPLIVTLHGYDVTISADTLRRSRGGRLYLRRQSALFAHTHTFICVSDFIRKQALLAGFPADKLWVHSIGIDLDAFRPSLSARASVATPVILFIGRLVEKKGCLHLLHAMHLVQRSRPARLVVIGEGPLRPSLQQAAHNLGLADCEFLGAQNASIIRNWMQQAAVFSVPSITAANGDAEGLGMVFLEAQAMGLPVVSFASGGIPEAVDHGRSGILVPEGDRRALAESILLLLNDQHLHSRISAGGRAHVADKFDLRKQTRLLEARYDAVRAGQPSADSRTFSPAMAAATPTHPRTRALPLSARQDSPAS